MVLHDVAKRSHRVVELAAVLDPEVLGHGDVDLGDALTVPQLRQAVVGEAQVLQFLDGLFAQKWSTRRIWSSSSTARSRALRSRADSRSWPNGFSIATRARSSRSAFARFSTMGANNAGGISR